MRHVVLLRLSLTSACLYTATGLGLESVAVRAFGFADVVDAGEIKERASTSIKAVGKLDYGRLTPVVCEIAEGGTVLSLLPEGTVVSRNQVVARLDSGELHSRLQSQAIAVAKAKSEWEVAKQQLIIHDVQFERKIAAALVDRNLAHLDREKNLHAEFPGKQRELLSAVEFAKRRMDQTDERMRASLRLADKGLLSQGLLDADRAAVGRAQLNLNLSRNRLKVLQELTQTRKRLKFDGDLQRAESQLNVLQKMAGTIRKQLELDVLAEQLAHQSARAEQEKLQRQIELCEIRAPFDGVVVSPKDRLTARGDDAPTQRQAVVFLSDLNILNVKIELNKSQARSVLPHQQVFIRFAKLPGQEFIGNVDAVHERRVKQADGMVRTKYFALVPVANPSRKLRPAMSARVEIRVGSCADDHSHRPVRQDSQIKTIRVTSGPMVGTITEWVKVESASAVVIPSKVEQAIVVRSILPQGTPVTAAQKVAELDSTKLHEQASHQKAVVTRTKADESQVRERLALLEAQNASAIAQAEIALKVSRLKLDEFTQGAYPQQRNAVLGEISIHRTDLKRTRQRLIWSQRVFKKGYITKSTLAADQLSVEERDAMLNRSRQKLQTLEKYTFKQKIAELKGRITESERELSRTKQETLARLAQGRSELAVMELSFTMELSKLEKIDEQIAGCILRAPCQGEVVHATLVDHPGGRAGLVGEGAIVRKGQNVVSVAKTKDVQTHIHLSTSQGNLVQRGQHVVISPVVQPDREFLGKVEKVSEARDNQSQDQRPKQVTIVLSGEPQQAIQSLTQGLMAVVEVQVPMDSVLRVPTDAVVQDNAESFCYIRTPQGVRKQKIVPGLSNGDVIEVKDGVHEGDLVIKNPWTVMGLGASGD